MYKRLACLAVLILIVVLVLRNVGQHENFKCSDNGTTNFCKWDVNKKKCYCVYQPGLANINFPQPPKCCDLSCNVLDEESCQTKDIHTNVVYYCPVDGECRGFKGYVTNTKVSANTCGIDKLNYQTIYPFLCKSDCEKSIKPCDQYNNSKYSRNQSRNLCLKDSFCGWCTNGQGIGKCVSGTAAGPINIYKYNFCKADNKNSVKNSYEYGKHLLDTEMM